MTYAHRDDVASDKATEANYDRWHERIDDEKTVEKDTTTEARTIAEILGDDDGH